MQLFQDDCKESKSEQQINVTEQVKQRTITPIKKMDKFYPPKPKINSFNELFTCHLCQGYIINPTTIDICTHTFCRSCIARHLAIECCCPQCGKTITITNLVADDTLRSIIFKLVPGLYQKERERLVQFVNNARNGSKEQSLSELLEADNDLFAPTDPISLSLEFHPILADQCPEGSVPPIRYLQCPASVKVQHLKRFLCSKFEIDVCNRRVGIDIIYEDEILPSDFTLMDIGYCYKWQRHAPLKLTYRILIYNDDFTPKSDNGYVSDDKDSENAYKVALEKSPSKNVSLVAVKTQISDSTERQHPTPTTGTHHTNKVKSSKSSTLKHSSLHATPSNQEEVPVKVTISRKPAENRKSVSKKSSSSDEFVIPTTTNDFKSLRSNDIRFSDYAITSSTTNTINANTHTIVAKNSPLPAPKKEKHHGVKEEKSAKCDIVVSIPHNHMQEEWETKPLSELKTASKKSPNPTCTEVAVAVAPPTKKIRNVPKLKIELNSLKTKLIEKPKSADIRLDTLLIKQHRPRKFSLDEPQPVMDKVDLETYIKNIGLKPIETQTTNKLEMPDKYTPNASPMSSCSSTTSSSTSNFNFNSSADITSTSSSSTSSSHKKRKKKHSKDSREPKDSKRRKMHAEISSHSAEESLKMKVKLTPPINLKSLKLESKRHAAFSIDKSLSQTVELEKSKLFSNKNERKDFEKPKSPEDKIHEKSKEKLKSRSCEIKKFKTSDSKFMADIRRQKDFEKPKPLEIKTTLGETTSKLLPKEFDDDEDLIIPDSTSLGLSKTLAAVKETNLPHSPPLPPSLFKTTPLTFSTFSPNVTTVAKPKPIALPKDYKEKPKISHMKPIAPKPVAIAAKPGPQSSLGPTSTFKAPHFAVPNPPRFMASNTTKFLSTPTSIASAANKHMGNLLKRSISLDDNSKSSGPSNNKQQKSEKPNQIKVSAYGLQMTIVEIPATKTSSMAKATFEIPLYSPLSASYNPKCSFSVNSTASVAKSTKATLQSPTNSSATSAKHTFTTNAAVNNKTDADAKQSATNDVKTSLALTCTTEKTMATNLNSRTSTTAVTTTTAAAATTSMATLMGPPLPLQKINSSSATVPTDVKSQPPLNIILPPFSSTSTSSSSSATLNSTPVLSTAYLSSPLSMVNYRQSKVLLAHVKPTNLPEMKMEKATFATPTLTAAATTAAVTLTTSTSTSTATATSTKISVSTTNGLAIDKPKSSLRQFRLPSRESGQDILDLSSASAKACVNGVTEKQPSKGTISAVSPQTTAPAGSSLEMALNKIKQNMTTTTTASATATSANSSALDQVIKKQELLSPISDDLQNLHLLSESATAREKITISTSTTLTSPSSTSLYEKAKITQNSLVRQQNASVRNIPNPSALAFRNQQPAATIIPPMVTIAAGLATTLSDFDKPLLLKTPSPPKSPHSPNCTTSSTSPSRIASKKHHPSIDQVAASLNQRASAAAEASAKANMKHTEETALVSSTSKSASASSLTERLINKEIKQESTETHSETSPTQPTSTANVCPLVNVLDIKQEPEEKTDEASEIKPPAFINVSAAKKPTMVENLVTSVINVTTPTSALLTATTAAGF